MNATQDARDEFGYHILRNDVTLPVFITVLQHFLQNVPYDL